MAGDEQVHALAEDQAIAHCRTVTIAGIHQGLEQIAAGRFVAPFLDVLDENSIGAGPHLLMLSQFSVDGKQGIQVRLQGLADDEFLNCGDRMTDEVDVFFLEFGAEERAGNHGEGHLHYVRVDVNGAQSGLSVEFTEGVVEGLAQENGEFLELFAIETFLDQTAVYAPCFALGGEQAAAQKVAHTLFLNL